jgi:hypothetical protein
MELDLSRNGPQSCKMASLDGRDFEPSDASTTVLVT